MEGRVRTKQFRLRMQDKEEPYGAHGYIGGTCFLLQIKQAAFDPRVFQNPSRDACFGVIDSIHELFDQADAGHGGQFPNPRRPGIHCRGAKMRTIGMAPRLE